MPFTTSPDATKEGRYCEIWRTVALDRMVAADVLPKELRFGAEFLAWSTLHGFAMLLIDGPLHGFARAQIDALVNPVLRPRI